MGGAVFGVELVEGGDDDVAVGVVGAGKEGFAKAGLAAGEAAVAADGRTRGEILEGGKLFPFLGDVDNAFALGILGAAEEGAVAAMAESHGRTAGGTGLIPIEVGVVVFFVEGQCLNRCSVVAVGIVGAAVEVFVAGPDFLELLAALGAVDFGEELGDDGFLLGFLNEGNEVAPKVADEVLPILIVLGDLLKLVFHLGGEGDVHDGGKALDEHFTDDFAKLGGF